MSAESIEGLRVCVVEDESRLRDLLVREIKAMGHAARGYRSAEDAWPELAAATFDTIILDLNLPGQNGMSLFERLHENELDLAVVILTGFSTLETAVQALRWDADDYLTKPCSLAEIEAVLARILVKRRGAAEVSPPPPMRAVADPAEGREPVAASTPGEGRSLEEIEREEILAALHRHQGNKPAAARQLGISLRTLYNKLHTYRVQGYVP